MHKENSENGNGAERIDPAPAPENGRVDDMDCAKPQGKQTAILVVNGGQDPPQGHWLEMCLLKTLEITVWPRLQVYVWIDKTAPRRVKNLVERLKQVSVVPADEQGAGGHPHAGPLQRLYERARSDGADYIVTLDTDSLPLKPEWLRTLIGALEAGAALAGIWRDELRAGIEPYIHPSCLCTTAAFIETNKLRFDAIPAGSGARNDTLSHFTRTALGRSLKIFKLRRSNANSFHRLIGGVYGDLVYHHGAGSRREVSFWDEVPEASLLAANKAVRDLSARLLFSHGARYLDWLRGVGPFCPEGGPVKGIFILGMHRSGTSCLAGSLRICGLDLGEVSLSNLYNPRGNHELARVNTLHDEILAANGGRWDNPPQEGIRLADNDRRAILDIVSELGRGGPAGLKDPRMLLMVRPWMEAAPDFALVGTYRHPEAVARSLARRDGMPPEKSYALWVRYNQELIDLHRTRPFPLVAFDLSNPRAYLETMVSLAVQWGLKPDLEALRNFISPELSRVPDDAGSVPPSCREVYDYLQANRFTGSSSTDAFTADLAILCEWGRAAQGARRREKGKMRAFMERFPRLARIVRLARIRLSAEKTRGERVPGAEKRHES